MIDYETQTKICQELDPTCARIVMVIDHHDVAADGVALSRELIAKETGIGVTTVKQAVRKLCASGWLESEKQVVGNYQTVNRYRLLNPTRHEADR